MNKIQKMLYFMRKNGEYREAIPADLINDKPAKILVHLVADKGKF